MSDGYPLSMRMTMRLMTRTLRGWLPPGEQLTAWDESMGGGDMWCLTGKALYMLPTPKRSNEGLTGVATARYPRDRMVSFEVIDRGSFLERRLIVRDADGGETSVESAYDGRRTGSLFDDALTRAVAGNRTG